MLQRVRRQIGETFETVSVTIATGWTQLEAIRNLLGDNVDVVAEPERRDTFPAIALSVSYLFFEKGVADDDVIVVMPCDTYDESGYFDAVRKMAALVEEGTAEIALMGVIPSYPSTMYGYIVPSVAVAEEGCRRVERFVEKPDADKAAELLSCGAYWNGGVFAFRAGYMMDIVRKYCSAGNFATVRDGYSVFPKISFDYEMVE
jgi:mannose-1-phosphate guanylyltransferase